ncbi:MAG: DUF547 domain-containing protein [Spirulinaceae cyanobacterium SM2_1_0]|nr:DUF547 domain-containing protein [Spirulinaceae cyanobacterium SM2_1_0]
MPTFMRSFLPLIPALLLAGSCASLPFSTANSGTAQEASATSGTLATDRYSEVLTTYVDESGLVDYEALQADRADLDAYADSLGALSPETYAAWSEEEQIAFLLNAYNAFTLQAIINQEPLKSSIRDIPGVWRIQKYRLAGEWRTLDNIEHDILRKDFNEPRIHAALVCAAMSCPPLRTEPYTGEDLDAQLEDQTQQWLDSAVGLEVDTEAKSVQISAIFDWFGEDWEASYSVAEGKFQGKERDRAILNFISQYVNPDERAFLEAGDYDFGYLDYDWSLNDQS